MKKLTYIILIILSVLCFHIIVRFIINANFLREYSKGNYDGNSVDYLKLINYPETYIAYFNKGNNYYKKRQFQSAIKEYEEALKTVTEARYCIVLNNLALSELELIDYKKDDAEKKLEDIQKQLTQNNCASEDENKDGENEDSQELYDEIEEYLNNGGSSNDSQDNGGSKEESDRENEIFEKMHEQQKDSSELREQELSDNKYEYYQGKQW